jgi:hypothetical protein
VETTEGDVAGAGDPEDAPHSGFPVGLAVIAVFVLAGQMLRSAGAFFEVQRDRFQTADMDGVDPVGSNFAPALVATDGSRC